jgi:hypothetical protein
VTASACYHRRVHGGLGKWIVGLLIAAAMGVQLLETTGRWDRALSDAGDEAAVVAVVLCIGVGFAVAAAVKARMRPARSESRALRLPRLEPSGRRPSVSVFVESPPTTLRI